MSKEPQFCSVCGKPLVESVHPTGRYDVVTGDKTYVTYRGCPEPAPSRWASIRGATDHDEWKKIAGDVWSRMSSV